MKRISAEKWLQDNSFLSKGSTTNDSDRLAEPPSEEVYSQIEPVKCIVIHHSATASGNAKCFRALHRGVFKWDDIGYHFVIGNGTYSGDGEIEKGRPITAIGAHSRGNNRDSIGICLVGDFEETRPTEKQLASLGSLLLELLNHFSLTADCIKFHREMKGNKTLCPGENLPKSLVLAVLSKHP